MSGNTMTLFSCASFGVLTREKNPSDSVGSAGQGVYAGVIKPRGGHQNTIKQRGGMRGKSEKDKRWESKDKRGLKCV